MSDCGGSGCNYEYEINSTFDIGDIDPPTVNDNCDSNISYDVSHNVDTSIAGIYFVTFTASDNSGNSVSTQVEVIVFDPLSVSENNLENIFIHPNPVKDILNIQNVYLDSKISVFDILGKNYHINAINNSERNSISFVTSELEKGLYFLNLEYIDTRQSKTLKFIKQ